MAAKAVATYGVYDDAWINGYSREFSRELGRRGWIGMTWPVGHGGGGRSPLERFVVTEALIKAGAPIAGVVVRRPPDGPDAASPTAPRTRSAQFLPGILSGETGWCIGMSEPDAGSDLASLGTRAVRDGDEYVVNGQKIWTSFGDDGRLLLPDLPHVDRRPAARRHQRDRSCRSTRPASRSTRSRT